MFNYPNLTPEPIVYAEQHCHRCQKWIVLDARAIAMLQSNWEPKLNQDARPFTEIECSHCSAKTTLMSVGKYDKPNTPRRQCACQFILTNRASLKLLATVGVKL